FLCNATTSVVVGRAIDDAVATGNGGHLFLWVGVLALLFLLNGVSVWLGRRFLEMILQQVSHDVRTAVTDRIQDPRGIGREGAGGERTAGGLLSIASTDANKAADIIVMTVFPVAELGSILYVAAVVLTVDWRLGLAVLLGAPAVVLLSVRAARPLRSRAGARQQALARTASVATDAVQGLRIIKGLGVVSTMKARYHGYSEKAYHATVAANAAEARLTATTQSIGAVYVVAVGVAAGWLALHDGHHPVHRRGVRRGRRRRRGLARPARRAHRRPAHHSRRPVAVRRPPDDDAGPQLRHPRGDLGRVRPPCRQRAHRPLRHTR
ncbi:MAG: ABC transporter ATP-binding protein, partial [Corynebacterium variabile]|uniref:ABC transporter ATP-binding protein n=1 Tax=Corynebacterium variabile TaxID=1727 RepID=UPI002647FD23